MPVLTPWSTWADSVPELAPFRRQLDAAVDELRRRHPTRRAFWGDDLAWELGATGLADSAIPTLTAVVRAIPVLRVEVNPTPPADRPEPASPGRSVLLASSPRAGNTIVRRMIVQLGLAEIALHDLDDLHWEAAQRPFVVQNHIAPGERADHFVAEQDAIVVTVTRHPLDVLLSVRSFSQREPGCRYWLDGTVGLAGVDLSSDEAFEAWALSDGATRLLDVSTEWATRPGVVVVRHEDVVADPSSVFARLAHDLGYPMPADADAAYAAASGGIRAEHRTSGDDASRRRVSPRVEDHLRRRR